MTMQITIVCVGKLKEKYWREAEQEYLKRLAPYARVKIIEVADESCPEEAGESVREQVRQKEGERLLAALPPHSWRVALDLRGKTCSSEEMAARVEEWLLAGWSHLVFVIGGSLGLADKVLAACQFKLSFGAFTYPHQLMRVILLEQIYRWQKIRRGEPYHK
ncbi:23S rRNA (pseudouridine1915-N3)-methyltransferase [Carboxydocella sporoproducens DSM 16521]|uniref:Ribosomal RNA large subunit methyltransferase H n=4 Tax=Clostridiales Family XVI. Incertae Sedis TaxID=543347 RepID=A0A1T4PMC1_9FIRM|nr:23S rRNA (pseudouridine1915-N3)-methyltransferase [Carboxydocella thermautotrophica]SJZ92501.1 23S rRNA (pseudouridine1915-N3)-methyltransferase [Carboxydocella sporoproducens DSM 16521]